MTRLPLTAAIALLLASQAAFSSLPTFSVWPGGEAPGAKNSPASESLVERSKDPSLPDRAVTGVRAPTITVYAPEKPNGIALLVTPGGSYQRVVLDKEGSDLAPVFNARGYTLFVMTYRMPADGHAEGSEAPLADAQRALRTLRARAADWHIDPQKIGIMGFSAGGHVAASLETRYSEPAYAAVDAVDQQSARYGLRGARLSGYFHGSGDCPSRIAQGIDWRNADGRAAAPLFTGAERHAANAADLYFPRGGRSFRAGG